MNMKTKVFKSALVSTEQVSTLIDKLILDSTTVYNTVLAFEQDRMLKLTAANLPITHSTKKELYDLISSGDGEPYDYNYISGAINSIDLTLKKYKGPKFYFPPPKDNKAVGVTSIHANGFDYDSELKTVSVKGVVLELDSDKGIPDKPYAITLSRKRSGGYAIKALYSVVAKPTLSTEYQLSQLSATDKKELDTALKPYSDEVLRVQKEYSNLVKKIKREGSTKELEEELENIRQKVSRRHLRLNVKTKELAKKYNKTSS